MHLSTLEFQTHLLAVEIHHTYRAKKDTERREVEGGGRVRERESKRERAECEEKGEKEMVCKQKEEKKIRTTSRWR